MRRRVWGGGEGARGTRVCPSAVGRARIAGRRMPSSRRPISRAAPRSLARLRVASVLAGWDARRQFKDP